MLKLEIGIGSLESGTVGMYKAKNKFAKPIKSPLWHEARVGNLSPVKGPFGLQIYALNELS